MMQTTAGIVLRTLKYKDTALLVDAYTESRGRATFQVPVPRRRQSGVRPSLFQPLTLVELEYEERPRTDLHRVTGARLLHPFVSLPFDPCKAAIALFLGEFLCRAIREELPHPALYAYLHHSICWLDACPQGYANFHLVFLMRLSRFLGLYPNLEDYVPGACFDLLNACFTPLPPQQHRFYLDADESSRLVTLMRMNYDTMHLFALNRQERGRCLTVLNDYYRLHLPNFPVLKSLEVLKELFD